MTEENFGLVLDQLAKVQPFQIFTIELHGGRRLEIDHPLALSARDGMAVFVAPGKIPIFFDHNSVNQIIVAPANTKLDKRKRT